VTRCGRRSVPVELNHLANHAQCHGCIKHYQQHTLSFLPPQLGARSIAYPAAMSNAITRLWPQLCRSFCRSFCLLCPSLAVAPQHLPSAPAFPAPTPTGLGRGTHEGPGRGRHCRRRLFKFRVLSARGAGQGERERVHQTSQGERERERSLLTIK